MQTLEIVRACGTRTFRRTDNGECLILAVVDGAIQRLLIGYNRFLRREIVLELDTIQANHWLSGNKDCRRIYHEANRTRN